MLHIVQTPFGANQESALKLLLKQYKPREIMLLVPEQFSFENERLLFETLGAQKMLHAQVLSFKRLAHQVFKAYGGLAGEYVTDASRNVLMALALEEVSLELSLYKKSAQYPAFVQKLCEMANELKNASVLPETLLQTGQEGLLGEKLKEVAYILQAYDALLKRGYHDPADDLTRAGAKLCEHPEFFAGKTVFLRAFAGFTQSEMLILRQVLLHAQDVFVLLDSSDVLNKLSEVDRAVNRTAARLLGLARRLETKVAPLMRMQREQKQDGALNFLAEHAFLDSEETWEGEVSSVVLKCANDPYEEAAHVCAQICTLVREEGFRFKDICIIARDLGTYGPILAQMGRRYGLPLFLDEREGVSHKPLMLFVLCALQIVSNHWQMDDVLSYLRCELLGFTPYEIACFENYVYIWNIKGASLKEPFFLHPQGLKGAFTAEDTQLLALLESMRAQMTAPLVKLGQSLQSTDGEGFAKALYGFLIECKMDEKCREKAGEYKVKGRFKEGEDYLRTWELLCQALETIARLLKGVHKPPVFYARVVQLLFLNLDLGNIPQTADQVLVGTADRVRIDSQKVVFVLGANEGVFPAVMGNYGLFTTDERRRLISLGIELTFDADMEEFVELSYAYKTLLSASERLYVSYSLFDAKGAPLAPSRIVSELKRLFVHIKTQVCKEDTLLLVQNIQTALGAYASHFYEDTPVRAALQKLIQQDPQAKERVCAFENAANATHFALKSEQAIQAVYGENLYLSPSRIESFHRCRFAYFLRYALGLKERKRAELSPIETGSVIHYVLEQVLAAYSPQELNALKKPQLLDILQRILEQYLQEQMGGQKGKGERFVYLFNRLQDTVYKLVRHLVREFLQSDFAPYAFEMDVGHREDVSPLHVKTADGQDVWVSGFIDRVDVMEQNGRKYVRVIDYKTGTKSFQLSDVFYGLNMQMLLYLFAIWQNGQKGLKNAYPAGILYLPAHNPITTAAREDDPQSILSQNEKRLRMSGLVLDDPDVIEGMEKHASGLYIPVKLKKDGTPDAYSSVCSLSQMGVLKKRVENILYEMAKRIKQGDIACVPVDNADYKPCEWCEYKSVCLHTEDDAVTPVKPIDEKTWLREEEPHA